VDADNGRITLVTDEIGAPNGLCFSPDHSKLYVADSGSGGEIKVWDVSGAGLRNGRRYTQLTLPGTDSITNADGIRCDVDGNVWCGTRPGVQIVAPDGATIGVIRLPEVCANVCFGGAKRNRLFMTASQSLYAVYVNVRGAGLA
jgi:gluconolactonase